MSKGVRNTLISLAGFIAVILGLFIYSMTASHKLTTEQYKKLGYFPFPKGRNIESFSLVNQDGKRVGESTLLGHWTLMYFGYTTCPDVCPTTLATIARGIKDLKKKPAVIMVTVDPDRDTPAKLKQYLAAFNPDFIGYTGTFDNIVALAQQVNVAFGKVPGTEKGSYLVDHSANIVVINPAGQYAGFIRPAPKAKNINTILSSLM